MQNLQDGGGLNIDVRVQVEHSVMMDDGQDNYRGPRQVSWDRKQTDTSNTPSSYRSHLELSSLSTTDTLELA